MNVPSSLLDDLPASMSISESDRLVDFALGWGDGFFLANGYKNGWPFNCYWSSAAGTLVDGRLRLKLYEEGDRYIGAEYRSYTSSFGYGYYGTKMKAASCSGVISSFFTYTNRPVWDEIDIEVLGKDSRKVQFNYFTDGKSDNNAHLHDLGFDSAKGFHEYGFLWREDSISWFVDGIRVHVANKNIPTHPQHIMMNLWNCTGQDYWSGPFNPSVLPVTAEYEYIAYVPLAE